MKVLFVDTACEGHHVVYLKNLVKSEKYQSISCLPQNCSEINSKQYIIEWNPQKNLLSYIKWINKIVKIAEREQVDIIQIMQMDSLMKYFAVCFRKLKRYAVVVVYHHFWSGFIRKLSYIFISRKVDYAIVHTKHIEDNLVGYGIHNIKRFEYPGFGRVSGKIQSNSPKKLLVFGSTRYDKGLDILLEALKCVHADFFLYIVGSDTYFNRKYIEEHIVQYEEKVHLDLRFVDDEEKEKYFTEADIIVLPYRRIFDGASGPLTDGVIKEKIIIGPNHGSINEIIVKNHIGYTFESESIESLARVITEAIDSEFVYDKKALSYKDYLSPERMRIEYEVLYKYLKTNSKESY